MAVRSWYLYRGHAHLPRGGSLGILALVHEYKKGARPSSNARASRPGQAQGSTDRHRGLSLRKPEKRNRRGGPLWPPAVAARVEYVYLRGRPPHGQARGPDRHRGLSLRKTVGLYRDSAFPVGKRSAPQSWPPPRNCPDLPFFPESRIPVSCARRGGESRSWSPGRGR